MRRRRRNLPGNPAGARHETNSPKVEKSVATPGAAGYQFQECPGDEAELITLERLFVTTLGDCGVCHNSSVTPPPKFASVEGLAKDLRDGKSCRGKPFVTPGAPDQSYLLDLLESPDLDCGKRQMPVGEPLSARAIAEVSAWITVGAPTSASVVSKPVGQDVDVTSDPDEQGNFTSDPDEQGNDSSDERPHDGPMDDVVPTSKDAGLRKDAGTASAASAARDAGRDAGKDAGRDAT